MSDRVYQLEHSEEVLHNVHAEESCKPPCAIHSKTDHSMRGFPQHWRSDRFMIERVNPFGGACPDPDSSWSKADPNWIHGCVINPAYPNVGMCSSWTIDGVDAAWITTVYAVTKDGRVWSYLRNQGPRNDNKAIAIYNEPPRELAQKNNGRGYRTVCLIPGRKIVYVHRLVLTGWRGACPEGMDTRHLNGNRSDNRLENLAWGTRDEQESDQKRHGTKPMGDSHPNSRLTMELVSSARKMWLEGKKLVEIIDALSLTVHTATLHDALIGNTWKHCAVPPSRKRDGCYS